MPSRSENGLVLPREHGGESLGAEDRDDDREEVLDETVADELEVAIELEGWRDVGRWVLDEEGVDAASDLEETIEVGLGGSNVGLGEEREERESDATGKSERRKETYEQA